MTRAIVDVPGDAPIELDDSRLEPFRKGLSERPPVRLAFAAAHIVMLPAYEGVDHRSPAMHELVDWIDWDATFSLRRWLDDRGFGVAEAMDTAQRFATGWPVAQRLIEGTGRLGLRCGFIAGAGADHAGQISNTVELAAAVAHQAAFIRAAGGWPIILPQPWLASRGLDEDGFVDAYTAIIEASPGPLFVHWLGPMFHPAMEGYFPGESFARVMAHDPAKVRGCKLSLLDPELEHRVRRELLPRDQIVLTGDDCHFADLIGGDGPEGGRVEREIEIDGRTVPHGAFSHALLGVFDAIADPASLALRWLAAGDAAQFRRLLDPCEALGRVLFETPTAGYKSGLAFLSWLGGRQETFQLPFHEERARDRDHLLRAVRLAAQAGVFPDAALAAERLRRFLEGQA